jgi:hypothetical protein
MDAEQLHAFIVNAVQQGKQARSAQFLYLQVEDLNNHVQALQQTSSGHQAPTSQDDEPSHQSRDSHSDGDGEGEHEEPSVEEPSGAIVNSRVPTEQNLSDSHHSVIPHVFQKYLSHLPCICHSYGYLNWRSSLANPQTRMKYRTVSSP